MAHRAHDGHSLQLTPLTTSALTGHHLRLTRPAGGAVNNMWCV